MSLIKEAEDKTVKGRGRMVLLDKLSPRLLGLSDRVTISMIKVSDQEFLRRYEDALRSNYKIFNLLTSREAIMAMRMLGISHMPERIDAPANEMRFIISSSEAYLIDVDVYDEEPLAIYRLSPHA